MPGVPDENFHDVGRLLAEKYAHVKEWGDDNQKPSAAMWLEFILVLIAWAATFLLAIVSLIGPVRAEGHPGGLAADGCHSDRKNGGRHCHGGLSTGTATVPPQNGSVYFPTCAAARAAGAAPVYRGQPGYVTHLDRDGDGKACE